jgi:predicted DsbA family dithiol-disulfide isomerase
MAGGRLTVDIWSDIMCPFCYIGKRHFEKALEQFAHKDQVKVMWHSFQLDPGIPSPMPERVTVYEYLAKRKGMSYDDSVSMHATVVRMAAAAGLEYNFEKAVVANSFDAHRLIQLAKEQGKDDAAEERLFGAYFTEGKDLSDHKTLLELGTDMGMDPVAVTNALTGDDYAYKVKQDLQAADALGIRGVPFFVFASKYTVSGAMPVEGFAEALNKVSEMA